MCLWALLGRHLLCSPIGLAGLSRKEQGPRDGRQAQNAYPLPSAAPPVLVTQASALCPGWSHPCSAGGRWCCPQPVSIDVLGPEVERQGRPGLGARGDGGLRSVPSYISGLLSRCLSTPFSPSGVCLLFMCVSIYVSFPSGSLSLFSTPSLLSSSGDPGLIPSVGNIEFL